MLLTKKSMKLFTRIEGDLGGDKIRYTSFK